MSVNSYIDHTLLKADANEEQIYALIDEAKKYQFASVCVNPTWVKTAAELLKDSSVNVCTVIGFPLGASTSAVKAFEAKDAIANGADEIDMVINIGALKSRNLKLVEDDIKAVVEASGRRLVKVIIETCLLTDEEKVKLMPLLMEPDFMNFLTEVIPCLYGEVENGRLVQNELTAETASLAPWFGDLIDIGFFSDLFYEFNRSRAKVPQDRKKPQQKS